MPNQSPTSARGTLGAKGRKASRSFTLALSVSRMAGSRASARMERAPSARGPNSMRPWNQPTTCPSASASAVAARSASSESVS